MVGIAVGGVLGLVIEASRFRHDERKRRQDADVALRNALKEPRGKHYQAYCSALQVQNQQDRDIAKNAAVTEQLQHSIAEAHNKLLLKTDEHAVLELSNLQLLSACESRVPSNYLLHLACIVGAKTYAKMALKSMADVNFMVDGQACVQIAIQNGHERLAQLLINHGAEVTTYKRQIKKAPSKISSVREQPDRLIGRRHEKCPMCNLDVSLSQMDEHLQLCHQTCDATNLMAVQKNTLDNLAGDLIEDNYEVEELDISTFGHESYDGMDASKDWGYIARENGNFGSYPAHDDYGDESGNKEYW